MPVYSSASTSFYVSKHHRSQSRRALRPPYRRAGLAGWRFFRTRPFAGETWQGINPMGLHVALTNRRGDITDPERSSRGQLCFEALRYASAHAACNWVLDHLLHVQYNPYNMLLSDGVNAFCIHYDGHSARSTADTSTIPKDLRAVLYT